MSDLISTSPALPPMDQWAAPMVWGGTPLRGMDDLREFPQAAVFVRAEVTCVLAETIGPGMTRQTQKILPGLLRIDKQKPVEVHVPGLNGQCWTFRSGKQGRKTTWTLCAGKEFPATDPASEALLRQFTFDQITVQSIIPAYGSGKHICFQIRDDFTVQNLADAKDEDPDD